jgi:hypothetical protein
MKLNNLTIWFLLIKKYYMSRGALGTAVSFTGWQIFGQDQPHFKPITFLYLVRRKLFSRNFWSPPNEV